MNSKQKSPVKKIVLIVLTLLILVSAAVFHTQLADLWRLLGNQQAISEFVQQFGSFGPLVLFGLLVAQVFIAVIPGHALMIAGGFVYGPVVAITVTATSTILGSMVAFWVARRYGRKLVSRLAKSNMHIINHWDQIAEKQGALFFFFSFVLPIFPSDLMCYVAGLGKIEPRKFLTANVAGRLICAVTITLIGVFGFEQPWQFWAIVLVGMTFLFISWGIYKNKGSRNLLANLKDHSWIKSIKASIKYLVSNLKNRTGIVYREQKSTRSV